MRKFKATALLAALLGALAALVGLPAAHAGSGASTACPTTVLRSPFTIGTGGPGNGDVMVCFSTTPYGAGGGAGGSIFVSPDASTSTATVTITVICDEDGQVWPSCDTTNGASAGSVSRPTTYSAEDSGGPCLWVLGTQYLSSCSSQTAASFNPGDAPAVTTPSTGICLLSAGSTCYAYLSGVVVRAGYDSTAPTVRITTSYTGSKDVNVSPTCYAVLASCP